MPTFFVSPSPARGELDYGVIKRIIEEHQRRLPAYGWQEVDTEAHAQLVVGHLGTKSERLDVFHVHGLYPTGMLKLPKQCWAANSVVVENIRRAREIVAVSDWVAETFRRDMHRTPYVCGHGIDLEAWSRIVPSEKKAPYVIWNKSRTLGVCDPQPIIELAERIPDLLYMTTFLPDINRGGRNITVTGSLTTAQMWPLVKSASVYLATTKETYSISVLEAMASGVPVVGFNWGNVPSLVGDAGIMVPAYDYDALAEAIREALDRRAELGAKGLERVKMFTWEAAIERLAAIYDECLERKDHEGPKVTVVIPCHNYGQYVTQAIESVQAQTLQDWELIVVNDGSEDDSEQVIQAAIAEEPRASCIKNDEARGVAHARNMGIAEGSGKYITCLDADDMMGPAFLEKMAAALDEDPKLGLAYSGLIVMNDEGEHGEQVHAWPKQYEPERGMTGNQVPTLNMFRRRTWKNLGGYRQRFAPHGAGLEDGDFWVRILANGETARRATGEGLFFYRIHEKSATREHPPGDSTAYYDWYPWRENSQHPLASQLGVPSQGSWAVRDYDRPRVAIVIPVGPYHKDHMIDAIDSVEAQTYRFWEVIVVNDTGEDLDTSAWPFARKIDTEKGSMGPGHGRNLGTAATEAPLVVYLDADDVLQPTFLEDTLRLWLDEENGGGWIYTDFFYVKEDGTHRAWQAPEWESERLWRKGLCAVTCLYPVQAWIDVGGFDETIPHEDWEFHIKLALAGWCGTRLAKPLITYRHDTGLRREECIAEKGFIKIKKRYSEDSLKMCNCGRGGGKVKASARRPAPPAQVAGQVKQVGLEALDPAMLPVRPEEQFVLMMYVGKSTTDLLFKGRTGKPYLFSTERRLAWVNPLDAGRLARKSVLRVINPADLAGANAPALQMPHHTI